MSLSWTRYITGWRRIVEKIMEGPKYWEKRAKMKKKRGNSLAETVFTQPFEMVACDSRYPKTRHTGKVIFLPSENLNSCPSLLQSASHICTIYLFPVPLFLCRNMTFCHFFSFSCRKWRSFTSFIAETYSPISTCWLKLPKIWWKNKVWSIQVEHGLKKLPSFFVLVAAAAHLSQDGLWFPCPLCGSGEWPLPQTPWH